MLVNTADLDLWIEKKWNVLFIGRHGTGKTTIITEAFNRNKLKWLYFSASTMDPWVDFIGVPKEITNANGEVYLGLVRPECFARDEVEAIFVDEYNRAPKKVRNSILELIQFKSINGKKFNNLKIVWAAINPDDEEENDEKNSLSYDVEPLDPAQKDRFQIWVDMPYKCEESYFVEKYGMDWGKAAIEWWNDLDAQVKKVISPRRLDYALDVHRAGGNLRHVFPKNANIKNLVSKLSIGNIKDFINKLKENKEEAKKWLSTRANLEIIRPYLLAKDNFSFFVPLLPAEEISNYIMLDDKVGDGFRSKFFQEDFIEKNSDFKTIINSILVANKKRQDPFFNKIRKKLEDYRITHKIIPTEKVPIVLFMKNLQPTISKKISSIESLNYSPDNMQVYYDNWYNNDNRLATQYKKNFLNNLSREFSFKLSEHFCCVLVDFLFEHVVSSFHQSTIDKEYSTSEVFALVLHTIVTKQYSKALGQFHDHMVNLSKSEKGKLNAIFSKIFLVSSFDIDRLINSEQLNFQDDSSAITASEKASPEIATTNFDVSFSQQIKSEDARISA